MSRFFRFYANAIKTRPILTNTISGAITAALGDIGAQYIEKNNAHTDEMSNSWKYKPERTITNAIFGMTFAGAPIVYWYRYINRLFPGDSFRSAVSKVILNQLTWAPMINVCYFTYVTTILHSQRPVSEISDQVGEKLSKSLLPTIILSAKIWPILQMINFYYIPAQYRVIYVNIGGAVWNIYLAYEGYKKY